MGKSSRRVKSVLQAAHFLTAAERCRGRRFRATGGSSRRAVRVPIRCSEATLGQRNYYRALA